MRTARALRERRRGPGAVLASCVDDLPALPPGVRLRFVGRPWRASPSEGYPTAHMREQDRIAREALTLT